MMISKSVAAGATALALALTGAGGVAVATAATAESPCMAVQDQILTLEGTIGTLTDRLNADKEMGYSFAVVTDEIVTWARIQIDEYQLNGLRAEEYEVCVTRVSGGGSTPTPSPTSVG